MLMRRLREKVGSAGVDVSFLIWEAGMSWAVCTFRRFMRLPSKF
jgi:hypothetical protein